ncbi:MAG: tannase/feruloyl esterase family alpha/beta hydrolase [Betaproteobacteria bacterium]|nr:MAG: tannase/feruloyl esterase family alpha/beta hydrolase [Betaproteobacteria bacterium]
MRWGSWLLQNKHVFPDANANSQINQEGSMKKTKLMSVLATAVAVFSGACWSGGAQAAGPWNDHALGAIKNYDPPGQCADLMGMQILPQDIGLPTGGADVTSALFVRATDPLNANGEYCLVLGAIRPVDPTAPDINFRVNLPTHWNGKALQPGGGGYDGSRLERRVIRGER